MATRLTGLWWWIDRWRKSSAFMDMTLEQQGAYRNLLDEATLRGGPIPNDEHVLAKACGDAHVWKRIRTVVLARFRLTPDGWRNDTLDIVLARSAEIREARAAAGRRGAEERWRENGKPDGKRDGKPDDKQDGKADGNAIANTMARRMAPDPDPESTGRAARGPVRTDPGTSKDPGRRVAPGGRAKRAASAPLVDEQLLAKHGLGR